MVTQNVSEAVYCCSYTIDNGRQLEEEKEERPAGPERNKRRRALSSGSIAISPSPIALTLAQLP
jgi:hypothetical protein